MRRLFDLGVSITFIHTFEVAAIVVEKEDKEGRGRTGCLISDLLEGGREVTGSWGRIWQMGRKWRYGNGS